MIAAFLNQKGGVGKTTLALHLAGQWAREGQRVTVIDADPQGSALDWSAQRAREGLPRLFGVIGLARDTMHHEALALALGVDHVVIDGPPRVAALLRSALLAADLVLIPVQPSPFDGWASAEMLRLLEEARLFRPGLLARFVLNRCAARTVIARETRLALVGHEPAALMARIGQRVAFADAARTGRLVCDLRPQGIAAREIAALTTEIGGMVSCTLLTGDSALLMPWHGPYDMILADPPYGDTSLAWDRRIADWPGKALAALKPSGSLWVFGSLRSFLASNAAFRNAGWKYAQELVWEKQNGSSFHADRFRRVHELIVQFYRDDTPWRAVYNAVPTTPDARARTVWRKHRPPHMGQIDAGHYVSEDGGPRLMRSVIPVRNAHGRAIHPTEKPVALLEILIRTSCPPGGLVGDWFAGSGAAGVACRLIGRRYVGCEIDPVMAQKARDRIASVLPLGEGIAP